MKKILAIILSLALVMILPAFSAMAEGGTLIVRIGGDPVSFNPTISSDDNLYKPAQNFYNRLVKLDASKQIIPDLATSWEVSEDAMEITFHLWRTLTGATASPSPPRTWPIPSPM